MTACELYELWVKRLSGMSKIVGHLREQRNKVYAHCGAEHLDFEKLAEKYSISFIELQQLIDFALDVTIELTVILTGVEQSRVAENVGDLNGLLQYVSLGMLAYEKGITPDIASLAV